MSLRLRSVNGSLQLGQYMLLVRNRFLSAQLDSQQKQSAGRECSAHISLTQFSRASLPHSIAHTYRHAHTHTHKHTHTNINTHKHTYTHTNTLTHTRILTHAHNTHTLRHTYPHTHTQTRTHAHAHAHNAHAHTRTHLHTHTSFILSTLVSHPFRLSHLFIFVCCYYIWCLSPY